MKRPFIAAFLLLIASVLFCSNSSGQVRGYFPKPGPDDTVQDVSLIQLIGQPERFDGKPIRFIGFLRIEFEGNAIYLHREDFDHGISKNGIWIDIPADMTKHQKDEVNMHYVICSGVFRAGDHGHMDMSSGAITSVRRLELWSDEPRSKKALPPPPAR
jgi:hypothetical protein